MTRQQRAQLRAIERFASTEDPDLDRRMRGGLPSAALRRRMFWVIATGAVLFFLSILAVYPFGVLVGLTIVAGGAYLAQRTERGTVDLAGLLRCEPRPRSSEL